MSNYGSYHHNYNPDSQKIQDDDVTRAAMRMSISAWSKLELECATEKEADVLKKYILLCPFLSSDSPAVTTALIGIERSKNSSPAEVGSFTSFPESGSFGSDNVSHAEATRVAMRLAVSAWFELQRDSAFMSETDVMKKYIRLCPFVPPNNPVAVAILEELGEKTTHGLPELVVDHDSDSDGGLSPMEKRAVSRTNESNLRKRINFGDSCTSPTTQVTEGKPSRHGLSGVVLRFICLDIPLVVVFALLMTILWIHRLNESYLKPQLDAAFWDQERAEAENTYYHRFCDSNDITAHGPLDLILDEDATPTDAYNHQLKHGFTVFPGVLTDETSWNLRKHIDANNRNLTKEQSIFVIENENRYSYALGTEEPSVAQALMEIGNHEKLAPSLEKVLGPNPALIEMTAITSSYGAVPQYWHDDVISDGSAIKYARAFGPSYSVFIVLQNTTKEMGATSACPGTHYCSEADFDHVCDTQGFQVVNSDGHWRAGDALLMNMNSYHRGSAHVDPNALDRVMLILTFVPKPISRAESRQMSQGITFSIRWDMWGHTLSDLANAKTAMAQPWATLKALGLYKKPDAEWGVDYISSSTMRIVNRDNGFRRDELEEFIERGGIKWLPKFLHGQVCDDCEEEAWYEYLEDTLRRCKHFAFQVEIIAVVVYLLVFFVAGIVSDKQNRLKRFSLAMRRLVISHLLIFILWKVANHHVDNTDWAKDITNGRRYSNAFDDSMDFSGPEFIAPTTLPNQKDVLIETRLSSRQLFMYNDFVGNHPGNSFFQSLLRDGARTFGSYPKLFRDATVRSIIDAVYFNQGRFLLQGPYGYWMAIRRAEAIRYIRFELARNSNPFVNALRREIDFLVSDYKYGFLRQTILAQIDSVEYLADLETRLMKKVLEDPESKSDLKMTRTSARKKSSPIKFHRLFSVECMKTFRVNTISRSRRFELPTPERPKEPKANAWIKEGEVVEGSSKSHWYKAQVGKVSANGIYFLQYDDGETDFVGKGKIRKFTPYFVGERLEVYNNGDWMSCQVLAKNKNHSYKVIIEYSGQYLNGITGASLRRIGRSKRRDSPQVRRNHYAQ